MMHKKLLEDNFTLRQPICITFSGVEIASSDLPFHYFIPELYPTFNKQEQQWDWHTFPWTP